MTECYDLRAETHKLIALQEIDAEIYDLESEKSDYPVRRKELDDLLEGKKATMLSADEDLKKLQVAKNEKENELLGREEKIKKHNAELAQIKTNKEYKIMLEQIENIKADVSLLEEKILEDFDKIEAMQADRDKEKALFDEEQKKNEAEKEKLKSEEIKVDARLFAASKKRDGLAEGISGDIMKIYENIRSAKGRCALARVEGEVCGECNMRLRPQVINEVGIKKNIVFCESCARILYSRE